MQIHTQIKSKVLLLVLFMIPLMYDCIGQNVIRKEYSNWTNSNWVKDIHENFSYNSNGYLISNIITVPIGQDGEFINSRRITYEYENDTTLSLMRTEEWSNNQWLNLVMFKYAYHGNNLDSINVYLRWNNRWYHDQYVKHYYSQNTLDSSYTGDWDKISSKWVFNEKSIYQYSLSNLQTLLIKFWSVTQGWENRTQDKYTYTTFDSVLTQTQYNWNGQWILDTRDSLTYNTNFNLKHASSQYWDKNDNRWYEYYKIDFTYEGFLRKQLLAHMLNFNGIMEKQSKIDLIYGNPDGITDYKPLNNVLKVWPNPAFNKINLENKSNIIIDLVITDIKGSQVNDVRIHPRSKITMNVSSLSEGRYFLTSSDGLIKESFIIVR